MVTADNLEGAYDASYMPDIINSAVRHEYGDVCTQPTATLADRAA